MPDKISVQLQQNNLNAGNLLSTWSAQMFLLRELPGFFWMTLVGVVWAIYFWRQQFVLRRRFSANAVRSLSEIWRHAKESRFNSLILLLPLLMLCFVYLGFHVSGERGAIVGFAAFCVYAALTLIAERYPIAEFA